MKLNPFSSPHRPALAGRRGAVSAAHPLAVAAAQEILFSGGNAADALIAAQAVLAVVSPDACGLGGDSFVTLRRVDGSTVSFNGAGIAARSATAAATTGGAAVTVPGLVDLWASLSAAEGGLPLAQVLEPAAKLAEEGTRVDPGLADARHAQDARLRQGGAGEWALMGLGAGDRFTQSALAHLLRAIGRNGRAAFYEGAMGDAIAAAVASNSGALGPADFAAPSVEIKPPLTLPLPGLTLHVQPPHSQGVLLAMALKGWFAGSFAPGPAIDHIGVELTQAAFAHREAVARGAALLDLSLPIDPERAERRGGPRAYLHTAGVAVADAEGRVASSLVSVFDDFGSGVFVPEGGFCLNNRAGGFTAGENAFAPGKRPVHTLAPCIVEREREVVALSTPGADGQVQTLLQVILRWAVAGGDLAEVISSPRWRSENGELLVEQGLAAACDLAERGHIVAEMPSGAMRAGAVTAAGLVGETPFAVADWRRTTWAGVA